MRKFDEVDDIDIDIDARIADQPECADSLSILRREDSNIFKHLQLKLALG